MSAGLIFEEPPVNHGGGYPLGQSPIGVWLRELRDHPGVWAKWPQPCSGTIATNIRYGRSYGVIQGEYETRSVKIDGDVSRRTLYVRYVGGES